MGTVFYGDVIAHHGKEVMGAGVESRLITLHLQSGSRGMDSEAGLTFSFVLGIQPTGWGSLP